MHQRYLPIVLSLLLASTPWSAGAQQSSGDAASRPHLEALRPTHSAVRVESPPVIDGNLADPVWAAAPVATGFVQRQPNPGLPATQPTEARIVYTDNALYVGFRLYDSRPDSIAAPLARRDAGGIYSDWAYVMIDSYHDRRTAFVFAVNPRGVQKDYLVFNDAHEDISWDPVYEVATAIDSLGWTAEFRIPLSQLRFDPERDTWGLNLQRRIARNEEWSFWAPWPPNAPGYVSNFGTLTGMRGLRPPQRIELQPYVSTRLTRAPDQPGNPFYRANEPGASAGADLKVGLTSGLTLSGTVNPDFGQVEVDPAVVNLTAFETFFPERRPFFVEGADVFRFGQLRSNVNVYDRHFFYSRRIGRTPQRSLSGPNFLHVDAPEQTTILGAAKVTGRSGPWTVGVMDAVTAREEARFLTPDGEEVRTPVEPLTNFFLSRVRRDFRSGATVVGSMLSATHRDGGDAVFDGFLRSRAYFGGADFEHAWARRAWTLSGFLAGSRVEGSPDAIALTQRAPARYYQRPDADHVELVPGRTALVGHMGALALQHTGRWDLSMLYEETSPGFEINDHGFQGRTDYRHVAGLLGRRLNQPRGIFRNRGYFAFGIQGWNFGGDPILSLVGAGANATLTNLWSVGVEGQVRPSVYDDRLTRGGPLARVPTEWQLSPWLNTDSRRRLSFSTNANLSGNTDGDFRRSFRVTADWRPSAAVRAQVGPRIVRNRSSRQYLLAVNDPLAEATFGQRYVFADIEQYEVSMDTRLDWTFTPRLSLQLFAQPFIAAVDFRDFKEFRTPGALDFAVYGRDVGRIEREERPGSAALYRVFVDPAAAQPSFQFANPDFNRRSLRGNAVLRWEYRPGSTLFFVWQQQRSAREPIGDFRLSRDVGEVFNAPGTNVFLIKATYWFGR
jgi:hypothetical protein